MPQTKPSQPQSPLASARDQDLPSKSRAEKLVHRRFRWQWNMRLLWTSIGLFSIVMATSAASYFYHSSETAETFLSRAELAGEAGNYSEQAKWLNRYSMLRPNDIDAIVNTALAANAAADSAPPPKRRAATDNARKFLSLAIGRLGGDEHQEKTDQLRRLLIERQLQLAGPWFREAENQIIHLNAPFDDPQSVKWMARSLIGQVYEDMYLERFASDLERKADQVGFWETLTFQKPGDVLIKAVDQDPSDIDLIASLVDFSIDHPDAFELTEKTQQLRIAHLRQQVENRLEPLANNVDSHSFLIRYKFDSTDPNLDDAKNAIGKLTQIADPVAGRISNSNDEPIDGESPPPAARQQPPAYWDFALLNEVAFRSQIDAPEMARRYFDLLVNHRIPSVSNRTMEEVYLQSGQLALSQGDADDALEIWNQGLESINPDNIKLLGSIARIEVAKNQAEFDQLATRPSEQSLESVKRFREAIEKASRRLAKTTDQEMPRPARALIGRTIDSAKWRMNALGAILDSQTGKSQEAIETFEHLLNTQAEINTIERIDVATRLATLYQNQGIWDAAAAALSRAVELAPENAQLRALAADAWTRSGNRLEAHEQWRITGNSGSLIHKIGSIEANFNYQLRLPQPQRDFSGIRSSIRRIRQLLSSGTTDDSIDELQLQQSLRRLNVVELSLPRLGVSAEQHLESSEFANTIATLAEKSPDDENIQLYAAELLAGIGDIDRSNQALLRMESILGESSAAVAITRAKIMAAQGQFLEASQFLLALPDFDDTEVERIHQMAAGFASQASDLDLAYQALTTIPETNQSLVTLFLIAQLAASLPEDSDILRDKKTSSAELARQWKSELRKREGEQGSYWQFLEVSDLIGELRANPNKIERNDPTLLLARQMIRELALKRPRWGNAISLTGWLSAIEGKPEQSIPQLRRGIAAGDRQISTRQLLWEQLIRLNRMAEAEQEIDKADWTTNQAIDKYSTMRIQLAQRQGDFSRGLEMARNTVAARPDDVIAQIVLAQTAITAAARTTVDEDRTKRFKEAQDAIQSARAIAGKDQFPILSASLSLAFAQGDPDAVHQEIDTIEKSELVEYERLTLMSRGYIGLKEFKSALPLLKKADELRPTSRSHLALASLYRQLQQPDQEIDALREAQRSSPANAELRNKLAQAIATRDGKDINWEELGELLQSSDQVTVTNRFLHAIILSVHGDDDQKTQAITMLRELVKEKNSGSNDAARVLANLLQMQIVPDTENRVLTPADEKLAKRRMAEVKSLYESLTDISPFESVDVFRYASFLLTHGDENDWIRVGDLLKQLQSTKDGTLAALEIGVRLAKKTGRENESPQIVGEWAEGEIDNGLRGRSDIAAIAGSSLVKLGFVDDGLQWLETGYGEDPNLLENYVVVLNRANRFEKALDVCTRHHETHADVKSATLLAETMLNVTDAELITPHHRELVDKAVEENKKNAPLLESVATLQIQDENYERAVTLYLLIDKLEPDRIRTLNNLAMAYSEIPGREAGGLEPIKRAIQLAGEHPELLDTYGVILLRSGKISEAEKVFVKATTKSTEPRFQFHLILTLLKQDKKSDAKAHWKKLDLKNLNPSGLTAQERQRLAQLKKEFGTETKTSTEGQTSQ